jgi:hypothetical protein
MDVHEVHYGLGEEMRREDRGGDGSKALDVSVLETVTQRTFPRALLLVQDSDSSRSGRVLGFQTAPRAFLSPTNCEIPPKFRKKEAWWLFILASS